MEAGSAWKTCAVIGLVCAVTHALAAAELAGPTPLQDDAALHDVQFVGTQEGLAVGDHGAVWRTSDGGATWQFVSVPTRGSLRSVSLLTTQVGWIAGVEWLPYARLPSGVLLRTTDGGQTWHSVGQGPLPAIEYVRFFDLDEGLLVGRSTLSGPSGVWRTADGGKSWQPVAGPNVPGWNAARCVTPERGLLAGAEGHVAVLAGDQLRLARLPPFGLRRLRAVTVDAQARGWLVGDGGLLLSTTTGGVSWQTPAGSLPEDVHAVCDFLCVEHRGPLVWVAGQPGSVIWRSVDGGITWTASSTGHAAPLHQLRFVSDRQGIAVGALGSILLTNDGGETWEAVRGGERRAALLAVTSSSRSFVPELLATLSLEQGYRAVVHAPVNTARWEGFSQVQDAEDVLHAAVVEVGGNAGSMYPQLAVDLPGLHREGSKLLARWQAQTEGRAAKWLVGALVRELRMWRPSVIVVEEPVEGDVLTAWIQQATLTAVREAADPTRHREHLEAAGLSTWNVERVWLQLPAGQPGTLSVNFQTLLPRTGTSAQVRASAARALWEPSLAPRDALAFKQPLEAMTPERLSDLFSGVILSPGSAARRPLVTTPPDDLERVQRRLQQIRHLTAISGQAEVRSATSAQLVAQWSQAVQDWPAASAAALLAEQAQRCRRRGEFEHAEALYFELVRRYPEQPAALEGFRWLLQYWTSAEVAWQRRRQQGIVQVQVTNHVGQIAERLEQARAEGSSVLATPRTLSEAVPLQTAQAVNRNLSPRRTKGEGLLPDAWAGWRKRASELAAQLEQQSPALFQHPSVQLPLAALYRATGSAARADTIYRTYITQTSGTSARELAERELWLTATTGAVPRKVITCRYATARPYLDGVFSDACWQASQEVHLGVPDLAGRDLRNEEPSSAKKQALMPSASDSQGLVMLAYDTEFLYIAASLPRHSEAPPDPPQTTGRTHDADLSRHDTLSLALDVDRDYATWYELHVDQRGWTRDRCWEDDAWNPQWYVAVQGDDNRWRIEAAIPWQELTERPPLPQEAWGISLVRVIPAVAMYGWDTTAHWPPRWEQFGLVRFAAPTP